MPLIELQRVIFHRQNSLGAAESYLRHSGGYVREGSEGFRFFKGVQFDTLTFYNAFSPTRWRDNTALESVILTLSGSGAVLLSVYSAGLDGVKRSEDDDPEGVQGQRALHVVLTERRLDLAECPQVNVSLVDDRINDGDLIYFKVTPLEDGVLEAACFATDVPAPNHVRLGLVLTHFNRQEAVQVAVRRIEAELLQDPEFRNRCALMVVDNSRNSGIEAREAVSVIPNPNYGGAGGFARGLLGLERDGRFTHCVFMDDDASSEIESLRRIYKLMAYSTVDRLAVAGILLRSDSPSRVYERGAIFDGMCSRLCADLDISQPEELLLSEEGTRLANYGGWWLFGFKITDVNHYPFPFFVRGDDVAFCLMNRFKLITINGVASYGDSFESKNGVLTTYLDVRSHLVHQIAILNLHRIRVIYILSRFFLKALLSHEYGRVEAILLGMRDFGRGTEFFVKNMDMASRFPALRDITARNQRIVEVATYPDLVVPKNERENFLRKLARFATVNGLLLPDSLIHDETLLQSRGFRAKFSEIFRYRRVCYASTNLSDGYIVELNRLRALTLTLAFMFEGLRLAAIFTRLKKSYSRALPAVATKRFWSSIYPNEKFPK